MSEIMGENLNENDISIAHRLPPTKKAKDRLIVKFTRREKRDQIYSKRKNLKSKRTKDLPSVPTRNNSNIKYFRDYSKFNKDLYLDDIKLIDWHEILNPEKNLNEKVQEAINTLHKIVDKHVAIKLASQSKQRQLNKPRLTKGILKSTTLSKLGNLLVLLLKGKPKVKLSPRESLTITGLLHKKRTLPNYSITSLHYVPMSTLKQLYYILIYPYLTYGLMSWGTAYQNKLNKIKLENIFKLKIGALVHNIQYQKRIHLLPSMT
ncbi:unnamed protein product [Porites evermanni]|uniref:Uncharacterized protein n=1 Tax=Porites evermanni TaxID=104178 RepID=A0ABN8SL08_9CNID|nr:unnamed protein product [Porites evermanni]